MDLFPILGLVSSLPFGLIAYALPYLGKGQTKIWSTPGRCFLSVLDIPLNGKQGKCVSITTSSDRVSQLLNELPPQEPGVIRIYIEELPGDQDLLSHLQSILGHFKAQDIYNSRFVDYISAQDNIPALISQWNANPQWLITRNFLSVSSTKSGGKLRDLIFGQSTRHLLHGSVEMMTSLRCVPIEREREEGSGIWKEEGGRKERGNVNEKEIKRGAVKEGKVVIEIEEEAKGKEREEEKEEEEEAEEEEQKEEESPMVRT
jgi:hypothetical protein